MLRLRPIEDSELHLRVESELPEQVEVGQGSLLLVHGWCFHARRPIADLRLSLDGTTHAPIAHGMPRADVVNRLGPTVPDPANAYRSGFWGFVPVGPVPEPGVVELGIEASLAGGEVARRAVDTIELRPGIRPAAPSGREPPLIAVCMATFNPPPELFREQIESLRAQTYESWICLISDDESRPDSLEMIGEAVGDDPRFRVTQTGRRLGVYRNFERALSLVPDEAELVALSDHDDRWFPEKLQTLHEQLAGSPEMSLAYSDMRITDQRGGLISPTFWDERANNHRDLRSLVLVNTITGAASLFRRELLDYVLPFPPVLDERSFHDHWIGMAALAAGRVGYVDRPLYDYVQHPGAVQGHARSNDPPNPYLAPEPEPEEAAGPAGRATRRLGTLFSRPRLRGAVLTRLMTVRRNYRMNLRVRASAELLMLRCGPVLSRRKRRALRRSARLETSPLGFAWLSWRALLGTVRRSPTLGVERSLIGGALWRLGLGAIKRLRLRPLSPHRQNLAMALTLPLAGEPFGAARLHSMIAPLSLEVSAEAPARANLLIPTIDLGHFFGGYIAKFNLARKLAEAGLRVRVVCVDEPFYLPAGWRQEIERFEGLEGIMEKIEVELAHDRRKPLEVSSGDRFVATTWWTAHVAHRATQDVGAGRFLYLIQECEPLTFPMGSWAALARQTYDFPHYALFSTEFLREYFRRHGLGVFGSTDGAGDRDSVSFQNAITPVRPPSEEEMRDSQRRLLFYARPEVHAERNMFELGLLALAKAREDGVLDGWDLHGIGAQQPGAVRLGRELEIEILERKKQSDYASILRGHAVGLSLMLTPHPSLVPLEMAAAGMPVVTNTYENKTSEAMAEISENLIAVEPTIDGVVAGIRDAVAASGDHERRLRGSSVNWSTSWEDSFTPDLVERVKGFIEAG